MSPPRRPTNGLPEGDAAERPRLSVTSLSQYVRLRNCDRFLRLRLRPDEQQALLDRWGLTIQPLTPLLKESGEAFERDVEAQIAAEGYRTATVGENDHGAAARWLRQVREPVVLFQVPLEEALGRYTCTGVADIIRLQPGAGGVVDVLLADIKSSRKERMEHRLQVATYAYLLRQVAAREGVQLGTVEGCVLHAGEGEAVPGLRGAEPFDLETYVHVVERLAVEPGCTLDRIAGAPFEDVSYHLGYWCDGCLFNAVCMYDSAERRDLSLVPQMTAVEKRMLQQHGIDTLDDLAALMELPGRGSYDPPQPAPGHEETVRELGQVWPVGPNLPVLVQRARRALRRFDPSVASRTYLLDAGFGTLPDDAEHDPLIKVFIDAQGDYLEDRLYLLAACVEGPGGESVVVQSTDGPPTAAAERALVTAWVQGVLEAVADASGGAAQAHLHLYLYDALDQRVVLEGLKRHLDAVSVVPGFFDLMTQSPALDQPVVSFLARELAERKNLGLVCMPLHDAARMYGFDWDDGTHRHYDLFRARLFDNRRYVLCRTDGTLVPKPEDVPTRDERVVPIESASRFNSQIPLEYAYGAWGHFDEATDRLLAPFRAVRPEHLEAFAAHRVRALAHIEGRIRPKSKYTGKKLFDLSTLCDGAAPEGTLARSLEEFLFMEHHTALQETLQTYALPIERRVQAGEALLLQYEGPDDEDDELHWFRIAFDVVGVDPELTMKTFRHKEGSWMVLNAADESLSANQMKHGRLAVIQDLEAERVSLAFRWVYARGKQFKYYHPKREVEEGALYMLDVMADDLNADKVLEGLRHAGGNTVYRWLQALPAARPLPEEEAAFAETVSDYVDALEAPDQLTEAQRAVVQAWPGDRLLLVQGPPGTGKSHTLAWAILARLLQHVRRDEPFRVVVSCKTHKAILVALEAVLQKWGKMQGQPIREVDHLAFRGLRVVKLGGDDDSEAWPDGLHCLDTYDHKRELCDLLTEPYVILGATSGRLYNLAKYATDGKGVDWSWTPFDLLVFDEASQLSVPETVLAGTVLRDEGAMLVVGDHRQMPPIIAHDWEREEKRSVVSAEPYVSFFEYLLARGVRRVALDRSFRLHRRLAAFLEEHIYRQDDVALYSERTDGLPSVRGEGGFVEAALDPDHPIVFVEHDEAAAQRFNELERELVAPLIRACSGPLGLTGADGLGVVVPHRAQRALLRDEFPELASYDAIDTVERFQGGERDVIIVSATASDPDFVLSEADFLLDAKRLNVAISRPRKKLVVVASRTITSLLISDLDTFDQALVWKQLYHKCTRHPLWEGTVATYGVRVRGSLG